MDLFKITLRRNKKKFYESRKAFEKHWKYHFKYAKYSPVIAYQLDWENRCWKEIRRVGPDG